MNRILDVYLDKDLVGKLTQGDSGELEFIYNDNYCDKSNMGISISLPLEKGMVYTDKQVKAFFSGLLPDESVRGRLATYLGVSERNPFALLEAVGGDCAGALSLYPAGEKPNLNNDDIEILDDNRLKEILESIKARPMLAGDDGYRLSLAGAQDKIVVGFKKGKVQLIKSGKPTTHILKPIIERVKDSPLNELFCMRLAKKVGIDVPNAMVHFVDDKPYYLVERYDRINDKKGKITRLHQEDFCQAMGIPPEIKYQNEGGPNIKQCLELIENNSSQPAVDKIKFLDIVIFNYLIGNADAHGKNFSFIYKDNKPKLAPAYDLLSTDIYDLTDNMAMKIGGKNKPNKIYLINFHKLTDDTQASRNAIEKQIKNITSKIVDYANDLKSELETEGLKSTVFDEIINVVKDRADRLNK